MATNFFLIRNNIGCSEPLGLNRRKTMDYTTVKDKKDQRGTLKAIMDCKRSSHLSHLRTMAVVCLFLMLFGNTNVSCEALQIEVPRFDAILDLEDRVDGHQAGNYLLMPHIYRAFIRAGASPDLLGNTTTVSTTCQDSLKQYYTGLIDKKAWAWKMYDSTGKQTAGVFIGATTWTGNYDECLNPVTERCSKPGTVCRDPLQPRPHYCSVYMTQAPWMPILISAIKLPFPVPESPFIVDVCIPKNCSEQDIASVVQSFLDIDTFGDNITVSHVRCHRKRNIGGDIPALISAIILLIIVCMVAVGTVYDIYRRRKKVRVKQGPEIFIGYDEETDNYGILKILVSPRKRRRRRGTLSGSEPFDSTVKKESSKPHRVPRFRSVSEQVNPHPEGDEASHPIFNRMVSEPGPHSGLEDIPEDKEEGGNEDGRNGVGDGLRATSVTSVDASDIYYDGDELTSGDDMSHIGSAADGEGIPMNDMANNNADNHSHHSIQLAKKINRQHSIIEVRPTHRQKKLASSSNLFTDLLLSFSFRKNTRHILADPSADTLYCLNGVRVLSIGWIVLGNVYGTIYQNPDIVDNHVSAVKMTQSWWMQIVINTTLAADSFFVLSGCLGAYNFMKIKTREGKQKEKDWRKVMSYREYIFMIVHRLVRIFPCYGVLLLLGTNLMPYLGSGPRWSFEIDNVQACKKNWWSNALFINNFYDPDNMCQPHTYYLANDFQFFLVSPLVLIPLLIMPKLGFALIGFFVAVQIVVVSALNQGINGNVLRLRMNNYWSLIYVKPYSRIGVYCIGLGLGYLLYVSHKEIKFRKIPRYVGWFLTCAILFILPYVTYAENREGGRAWTGIETAIYEAFSRPAWALALSWVIFTCSTGQGAVVAKLLSWNMFLPLCRITYGVFLLHPILIAVVIESSHHNFFLNFGQLVYTYIALFVCSYGLAFILIAFVESPFTTFESHIRMRFKEWRKERTLQKIGRY